MCVCVCFCVHEHGVLLRKTFRDAVGLKLQRGQKILSSEGWRCDSTKTTKHIYTHTHAQYIHLHKHMKGTSLVLPTNKPTHPTIIVLHLPINIQTSVSLCSCSLISKTVYQLVHWSQCPWESCSSRCSCSLRALCHLHATVSTKELPQSYWASVFISFFSQKGLGFFVCFFKSL